MGVYWLNSAKVHLGLPALLPLVFLPTQSIFTSINCNDNLP